jgi:hypothetical protein
MSFEIKSTWSCRMLKCEHCSELSGRLPVEKKKVKFGNVVVKCFLFVFCDCTIIVLVVFVVAKDP